MNKSVNYLQPGVLQSMGSLFQVEVLTSCLLVSAVAVVQSLSQIQPFATPWTAACQASLSFTVSELLPASLVAQLVKNLPAMQGPGFNPWVGKIPGRRERLPTPVFWPGEFHGVAKSWTGLSNFHFQWNSRDFILFFLPICLKKALYHERLPLSWGIKFRT